MWQSTSQSHDETSDGLLSARRSLVHDLIYLTSCVTIRLQVVDSRYLQSNSLLLIQKHLTRHVTSWPISYHTSSDDRNRINRTPQSKRPNANAPCKRDRQTKHHKHKGRHHRKYSLRPGRDTGSWRMSSDTALNSLNVGLRSSRISQTDARFPQR